MTRSYVTREEETQGSPWNSAWGLWVWVWVSLDEKKEGTQSMVTQLGHAVLAA
jgi:hypothetical protein